jgi:hypothetical protein
MVASFAFGTTFEMFSNLKLSLLGLALLAQAAEGVVYFNIDFSSPPHQVGSQPAYGGGPDRPTSNWFGSPQVMSSFGALTDQPLLLNTAGNAGSFYYDQFSLDLAYSQPTYHIAFDVYTEDLVGSRNQFSMIMDFAQVSALRLYNDGVLAAAGPLNPPIRSRYVDRTLMHVDVSVDVATNRAVTLVDGLLIGDGKITGNVAPGDLKRVRFSMGLLSGADPQDNRSNVAIDNIVVTNGFVVPESGASGLVMLSAMIGLAFRRRNIV